MQRSQDLGTLKRRVHQIMSRSLVTISPDATIDEAARIMRSERVSCLPVVDEAGAAVGIITVRDFLPYATDGEEG